jgi:hypothetical protein
MTISKMALVLLLLVAGSWQVGGETPSPVGTWRGESKCVTNAPACHDEQVVYYITAIADRSDALSVRADKIVDGKAITMGTGPWTWDSKRQTLTMEWRGQFWQVTMHGDRMDGTLTTAEKVVFRRMLLNRDQAGK